MVRGAPYAVSGNTLEQTWRIIHGAPRTFSS